jgi:hypothetical protein
VSIRRALVLIAVGTVVGTAFFGLLDRLNAPPVVRGDDRARPIEVAIAEADPEEIVSVLPRDTIAAIFETETIPAHEAELGDDERVVGVVVAGAARAYPVAVLSAHEVANDQAGGIPFAVTWCPLCSTAVVYRRDVDGTTLSFGVSGSLYRNSLVLYDRETETLWSHVLGVALRGPLRGTRLTTIPSVVTTWGSWRRAHPRTRVLDAGRAPYDPYESYYRSGRTGLEQVARVDPRLGGKELVLAVLSPSAKAYAFRDLERLGRIRDTLDGRRIEVVYDAAAASATAWSVGAGGREPLPSTPIFWFAWVDIFPGAPLWTPQE